MLTAIVTDVKYRMSLAVIRDLARAGVRVVACQMDEGPDAPKPPGFSSRHASQTHLLSSRRYLDELHALCRSLSEQEGNRPALLPVGAKTLALLAEPEARARFDAVCGLCIPTQEQLALLNDKEGVAQLASVLGIPVPRSFAREEGEPEEGFFARIPLPCVVKPRCGEALGLSAEKRYAIARTPEELRAHYLHFQEAAGEAPLVQDYLTGAAKGCSVLAQDGAIVRRLCHRRIREYPVSGGPSTRCDAIRDERLEDAAERLALACGLNGLAMFEFKENAQGVPHLLEVNPRVWGTYPLTRITKSGFSLAWFTLGWNAANPEQAISLPDAPPRGGKLQFFPSDLAAARAYRAAGTPRRARGALLDLLRPDVRDGLFEWGDMRPAFSYWMSLLKRGNRF